MRSLIVIRTLTLAVASLTLAASVADAKTCRDTSGKFVACPAAPARTAGARAAGTCRDAAGHFTKCGAAPATPAPRASASNAPTPGGGLLDALRRRAAPATPANPAARAATTAGHPASATVARGAPTARCKDGSLSYSQHRSGTCAGHHGVAAWM